MTSTTVSKRLVTVFPRQSRALSTSLYSPLPPIDPVPPPRPSTVASSRPGSSSGSSSNTPAPLPPPSKPSLPPPALALGGSSGSSAFPAPHFTSHHFPYLNSTLSFVTPVRDAARNGYALSAAAFGIPKRRAHTICTPPFLAAEQRLSVQVGEDAYFLRPDALGVADGVGGWSKASTRPSSSSSSSSSSLFSLTLMHHCSSLLSSLPPPTPTSTPPDPISILHNAFLATLSLFSSMSLTTGSTTALLALLHNNTLHVAHLGDCALALVRGGQLVYRSAEMQHGFNCPVQLGPRSDARPDTHAQRIELPVQTNDIVILSSDGMTDNLWDSDVLDEVRKFTNGPLFAREKKEVSPALPALLSQALCSRAKRVSEGMPEEQQQVPFASRAQQAGMHFVGGKIDDISVLVAVISPSPAAEPSSMSTSHSTAHTPSEPSCES